MHIVVLDEHLLTDMVLIELVGHDVRSLGSDQILHLVFFTDNLRSWVELLEIVDNCVLNVNISLSKDILHTVITDFGHRHSSEVRFLSDPVDAPLGPLPKPAAARQAAGCRPRSCR